MVLHLPNASSRPPPSSDSAEGVISTVFPLSRIGHHFVPCFRDLQWLFRPPPFISWADLRAETVTIENPSAWKAASLDGYTLNDRHQRHTYKFPPGCVVRARSKLIREWACRRTRSAQVLASS